MAGSWLQVKKTIGPWLLLSATTFLISEGATAQQIPYPVRSISGGAVISLDGNGGFWRAAGDATAYDADDQVAWDYTISGQLKAHQTAPPIDFVMGMSGQGQMSASFYGPADYSKCYWAGISATAGAVSLSSTSETSCMPPPPPAKNPTPIAECPTSPIVVNLGTGEYELSGASDPVMFDIDADGAPNKIGWTARGTALAFLALDRNSNGQVDNGSELFGTATVLKNVQLAENGFIALADLDDNGDGVIDSRDRVWNQLLLWCDTNHDGVSQPWEIQRVAQSVVRGIGTRYVTTGRRDQYGNLFRYESFVLVTGKNGRANPRPVYDIFFVPVP
jgi:hypothetical protein